jgi:hypothetical protein
MRTDIVERPLSANSRPFVGLCLRVVLSELRPFATRPDSIRQPPVIGSIIEAPQFAAPNVPFLRCGSEPYGLKFEHWEGQMSSVALGD